ncbi:pentatricopeptide repeat-containing protein At1g62260, mitochondrial [Rutidosis leptorrhynchoides]|uniref:pentatricopeptide repeat-containing protein At1g62260, mitochondrial n=1 Tax=Rutidosis leptorrhynchoides TaxID=125765 RepID=UPI003A9A6370
MVIRLTRLMRRYGTIMRPNYLRIYISRSYSELLPEFDNSMIRILNTKIKTLIKNTTLDDARLMFDKSKDKNTVTWNLMLDGYVKRNEIVKARQLFGEMPVRDSVSWNTMISGYVRCKCLDEGRLVFDEMPCRDIVSWNTMISGYAKIGRMNEALKLFNQMPNRNVVSWNAMVSGYLQNGDSKNAVSFFKKMPKRDAASLSALVSGLVQNGELDKAGTFLLEITCENDDRLDLVHAYNTLIAGYGRIGRIEDARRFFDRIPYGNNNQMRSDRFKRNLVSWNIMIMSYVKAKDVVSARILFDQMTERDTYTWNTMINGYIETCDIEEACNLITKMPNPDVYTWNSLLLGFSEVGQLEKARELFRRMPRRNRVSWNTIIAAYEKHKQYREAIELYIEMQLEGEKPDRHTLSSLLSACAEIADIHLGIQIHPQVTKFFIPDVPLNNSLITMYARCGAITEARAIFNEMKLCKDVISWNAMIGGYASHGYATKALELFASMKKVSVKPTYITFISVLNACANAGLADEGRMHFNSMVNEFGIKPRVEHYATLVDIMGRNGKLEEAMDVIKGMVVEPDKAVWGALLGGCKVHNNIKLARVAAEALIRLEPESSTAYVLLHNMYADIGQWEDATEIRMLMEKHNIRKSAGYSLVDSSSI